jgi:hypothetical protein
MSHSHQRCPTAILTATLNEFISGEFSNPFEFPGFAFRFGFGNARQSHVHFGLGDRQSAFLRDRAFTGLEDTLLQHHGGNVVGNILRRWSGNPP